ncbi:type VI secretion system-associated protein TagO [Chelativorans alearense]|uniref:type VI secretion system-associated protein TagO n=1 Tax=Chelativorans alearense TaxID=2681495 RepID=UPI0013D323BF|nr:type VI secretion system-associated protein TagO [Chelativorans alearense]
MRTIVTAAAILAAGSAIAAPDACIQIDSDLDRLACYDREAGRTPKQEILPTPAGKWSVRKETSKLTDQTNVFLTVASEETVNCGWNSGDKIRLYVRCMENSTSLIFQTGCHMTSSDYNDYGHITYRLDDEKARTVSGDESTNNRSLGLWSGGRSIPVIKQMFGKSQMIVRMTPYSESPFTATFNIAGLDEAITPLRQACSW